MAGRTLAGRYRHGPGNRAQPIERRGGEPSRLSASGYRSSGSTMRIVSTLFGS